MFFKKALVSAVALMGVVAIGFLAQSIEAAVIRSVEPKSVNDAIAVNHFITRILDDKISWTTQAKRNDWSSTSLHKRDSFGDTKAVGERVALAERKEKDCKLDPSCCIHKLGQTCLEWGKAPAEKDGSKNVDDVTPVGHATRESLDRSVLGIDDKSTSPLQRDPQVDVDAINGRGEWSTSLLDRDSIGNSNIFEERSAASERKKHEKPCSRNPACCVHPRNGGCLVWGKAEEDDLDIDEAVRPAIEHSTRDSQERSDQNMITSTASSVQRDTLNPTLNERGTPYGCTRYHERCCSSIKKCHHTSVVLKDHIKQTWIDHQSGQEVEVLQFSGCSHHGKGGQQTCMALVIEDA